MNLSTQSKLEAPDILETPDLTDSLSSTYSDNLGSFAPYYWVCYLMLSSSYCKLDAFTLDLSLIKLFNLIYI